MVEAKVLIVDDEANVRSALRRSLRKTSFHVGEASSGKEALGMLEQVDYNVVISDLKMPEMDGVEFLSLVTELFPETSQILLSGHADRENLGQAINQCNIEHFLNKPWTQGDLIAKTEQVVCDNNFERTRRKEIDHLDKELAMAADMQLSLFPDPINNGKLTVDWYYQACAQLGGDGFGYKIEDGMLKFYLLDVVGHGTPAAMESFALQHLLANARLEDPAAVATQMNRNYAYKHDPMRYFTMVCGALNLNTGELAFCQAGHPPPIIVRNGGRTPGKYGQGGFPIGLIDDASFETTYAQLNVGDLLLLYSDGFEDEEKEELVSFLQTRRPLDNSVLQEDLKKWASTREVTDDVSALFITRSK